MKTLLKNGTVINVFTGEMERANVLLDKDKIVGVGSYSEADADCTEDVTDAFICPGFIDGHIHIESTMLTPSELARASMPHGTTAVIADPHEIANVCGKLGIDYILEASRGIPLSVYIMLPSCVPATSLDENGAVLDAGELRPLYQCPRVLGLGEMMNYPGVISSDQKVMEKIIDAHAFGKLINGHAPLLTGRDLDKYIAAGISDDHECSSAEEAMERIRKGQWVMIRQGTAARNLESLLPLFEEPWASRCLLVTDDRHPADLLQDGHIDNMVRMAVKAGKSPVTAIRMASLQAAEYYGLRGIGAVAPGYRADFLVLDDLDEIKVRDVYAGGEKVVANKKMQPFENPSIRPDIWDSVCNSFHLDELKQEDFHIEPRKGRCRVIRLVPQQLFTDEWITEINFDKENGVDLQRDILKLAVIERHKNTGHKGIGYISGIGLKSGAIAASVSHDSHNLIVIGTNEKDMAMAANQIRVSGGGNVVVRDRKIMAEMPLPIAGLMSSLSAKEVACQNEKVRQAISKLGASEGIEPFMNMAFLSLPVIPSLKMTTKGLVDVSRQELVSLFVD